MVESCDDGEELNRWINEDPKKIFVVVPPANAAGDLPDARQRAELCRLGAVYRRIVVILNCGPGSQAPPELREVKPPLDDRVEQQAVVKELMAKRFVDNFGRE